MLTFRYWLRNLFTDDDGAFSERRWTVLSVVAAVLATAGLALACSNLPATSQQQSVTVTVNDPGGARVTVVVQP